MSHGQSVNQIDDALLFCAIFFRICKAKSSSQMGAFFTQCLPIKLALKTILARGSERESFFFTKL